jgi:hypothetical protein
MAIPRISIILAELNPAKKSAKRICQVRKRLLFSVICSRNILNSILAFCKPGPKPLQDRVLEKQHPDSPVSSRVELDLQHFLVAKFKISDKIIKVAAHLGKSGFYAHFFFWKGRDDGKRGTGKIA